MRLDHLLSKETSADEILWSSVLRSVQSAGRFTLFNLEGVLGASRWGFSSAGRAPALQAGGQRFDPANLHHLLSFEKESKQRKLSTKSFQRELDNRKAKDGPIAQLARAHD